MSNFRDMQCTCTTSRWGSSRLTYFPNKWLPESNEWIVSNSACGGAFFSHDCFSFVFETKYFEWFKSLHRKINIFLRCCFIGFLSRAACAFWTISYAQYVLGAINYAIFSHGTQFRVVILQRKLYIEPELRIVFFFYDRNIRWPHIRH